MPTTTRAAIPYPANTDPVANGAAAMQALAERVDKLPGAVEALAYSTGTPAGGTTSGGTALTVNSLTVAAVTYPRLLIVLATVYGTKTVASDDMDAHLIVDGTIYSTIRDASTDNISGTMFAIASQAANTAVALSVQLQRNAGTGTATASTVQRFQRIAAVAIPLTAP